MINSLVGILLSAVAELPFSGPFAFVVVVRQPPLPVSFVRDALLSRHSALL